MSEQVKTTDQTKEGTQRVNDRLEKAPDAPEIRNASKDQVDNAHAQNPIRTKGITELAYKDGFVDSPDKRSMELEAIDSAGNRVTIDKTSSKRQKDICLDPHPTRMMPAMTPEAEAKIKAPKQAKHEQISQSATLMAIEADKNPAMHPVALGRQHADSLPPEDPQKQKLTELSRELAAKYSPEMRARYEQFDGGTHKAIKSDNLTNTPEGWLTVAQKIAQLPMDKQLEVIGAGLLSGIEQYQHDERERAWGQLIGTVQGTGEILQGLAKIADFGAACILGDNERAGKMGEEFGTALGQTIVGGVRLFQAADQYLFNIGYTGDYAKPFRDVVLVGQKLDEQWSHLPPREQERIKAKLITELLESGAIGAGGASAIQKTSKFTEILDTIAVEAKQLHAAAKPAIKKAVKAINNAVDELVQPVGDTGMGVRMPISKDPLKDETKMLMSKADDVGEHGPHSEKGTKGEPVPEKFKVSHRFMAELKQAIEGLSSGEKSFLKEREVDIKPVRRLPDVVPGTEGLGACYSPEHKTIFVPEEIMRIGKWVPNDDVSFALRHEFGHVFSAKFDALKHALSDDPSFIQAFKSDFSRLSASKLNELRLSGRSPANARDEVFADMYAHVSAQCAGVTTNSQYSIKLKESFPNCLKYLEEF